MGSSQCIEAQRGLHPRCKDCTSVPARLQIGGIWYSEAFAEKDMDMGIHADINTEMGHDIETTVDIYIDIDIDSNMDMDIEVDININIDVSIPTSCIYIYIYTSKGIDMDMGMGMDLDIGIGICTSRDREIER